MSSDKDALCVRDGLSCILDSVHRIGVYLQEHPDMDVGEVREPLASVVKQMEKLTAAASDASGADGRLQRAIHDAKLGASWIGDRLRIASDDVSGNEGMSAEPTLAGIWPTKSSASISSMSNGAGGAPLSALPSYGRVVGNFDEL